MQKLFRIFILAATITTILTLVVRVIWSKDYRVLSFATEVTPTTLPSPTEFLLPTPTPLPEPTMLPTAIPTSKPTSTPTPTIIAQPQYTKEQIHGFIERFSAQYGVDVNVMRHIAACESGFNPSAINGPYAGLYQFGKSSWSANRILMGEDANFDLRYNAEEAAQTAAYILSVGKGWVWPNCLP